MTGTEETPQVLCPICGESTKAGRIDYVKWETHAEYTCSKGHEFQMVWLT